MMANSICASGHGRKMNSLNAIKAYQKMKRTFAEIEREKGTTYLKMKEK